MTESYQFDGALLRVARITEGLSPAMLAAEMSLLRGLRKVFTKAQILSWETGTTRPSANNIGLLATALHRTPNDFYHPWVPFATNGEA